MHAPSPQALVYPRGALAAEMPDLLTQRRIKSQMNLYGQEATFGQGRPPPLSRAFIWATFIPKIRGLNAHLKRSGRAIEAHYQFLLSLVPSARA